MGTVPSLSWSLSWTLVLLDMGWASGNSDAMLFMQQAGCSLPLPQFH